MKKGKIKKKIGIDNGLLKIFFSMTWHKHKKEKKQTLSFINDDDYSDSYH